MSIQQKVHKPQENIMSKRAKDTKEAQLDGDCPLAQNTSYTDQLIHRLEFINKLELPISPANDEQKPTASVDDTMIIAFDATVSAQSQEDMLNAWLLAELVAKKKYPDPEADIHNFYSDIRNTLLHIGFVFDDIKWSNYESSSGSFTVDKAILEVAAAFLTGDELLIVQKTLDALSEAAGAGDNSFTIWSSNSQKGNSGHFEVSCATEVNNLAYCKMSAFYFSANNVSDRFLWTTYQNTNMNLYKSTTQLILDTQVYSQVRQPIIQKLGSNAKNFVASLPPL